jgi:hypothetical protein
MDSDKLILLVQQYDELYNFKNSNCSNQQRRQNIWDEIGKAMKETGKILTLLSKLYHYNQFSVM